MSNQIKFYNGTSNEFALSDNIEEKDISYINDSKRLYVGKNLIGQNLDNLDVGRGNTINATKGRFGGATIGKDNFVGRMGYYIYPDWNTLSEDGCSVKVYFIDHQIGYYPEDVTIKMKKLAQQDNDDCLTNNHVFSCGSTCKGWEHYAHLVGYSEYSLEGGIAFLSGNFNYSDLTIYPEFTFDFTGYKAIINKTTYNVLYYSMDAKYTSNDGLIELGKSVTLTFDKALPTSYADSLEALFYNYAIPTDIWTNDWTLSNPNNPQTGAFNIAEPTLAMGRRNKAYGSESFAIGRDNIATGDVSVAWGNHGIASGPCSFALSGSSASDKIYTTASGQGAFAVGRGALASGNYSVAFGGLSGIPTTESSATHVKVTTASGAGSFAAGYLSLASGNYSIAHGAESRAMSNSSIALGYKATAGVSGESNDNHGAIALGMYVKASRSGQAAIGYNLETNSNSAANKGQVVVGAYNVLPERTHFFVVGTGSADAKYSTFIVGHQKVQINGAATVSGSLSAGAATCNSLNVTGVVTNTLKIDTSSDDKLSVYKDGAKSFYVTGTVMHSKMGRSLLQSPDIQLRGRTVVTPKSLNDNVYSDEYFVVAADASNPRLSVNNSRMVLTNIPLQFARASSNNLHGVLWANAGQLYFHEDTEDTVDSNRVVLACNYQDILTFGATSSTSVGAILTWDGSKFIPTSLPIDPSF